MMVRRLLQESIEITRAVARRWRLWLTLGVLGALFMIASVLAAPRRWGSEGYVTLRPEIMLEGYFLAAADLAPSYALRLQEEARVDRALAASDLDVEATVAETEVLAWPEAGTGIVRLRVVHPNRERAEDIARALLVDFRSELEAENRTREEQDRIEIELSKTSFAREIAPPVLSSFLLGFLAGAACGMGAVLVDHWMRRERVLAPLEAEQLTGAPTLAAIPRR